MARRLTPAEFAALHRADPTLYRDFCSATRRLIAQGVSGRVSADYVLHTVRLHQRRSALNHSSSYLGRMWNRDFPGAAIVFPTKLSIADEAPPPPSPQMRMDL